MATKEENLEFYPLKHYEGFFEISLNGIVRSVERYSINSRGQNRLIKSKELKPYLNNSGYYLVQFSINGKHESNLLHRLIANNFIPNKEEKPCVNHINCVKTDNRIENLEWCTYSENNTHIYRSGCINKNRVLSDEDVKFIYLNGVIGKSGCHLDNPSNVSYLQDKYNVGRVAIHNIIKGLTYKNITKNLKRS